MEPCILTTNLIHGDSRSHSAASGLMAASIDDWARWFRQQTVTPDRRRRRRYPIPLELHWKLVSKVTTLERRDGRTLDLSSSGIAFQTDCELPVGEGVELFLNWPAKLLTTPLQLVVAGRLVRSDAQCSAICILRHEFRTQGTHSSWLPFLTVAAAAGASSGDRLRAGRRKRAAGMT